jgi:outer membrane receptor protein involved in Fe transport
MRMPCNFRIFLAVMVVTAALCGSTFAQSNGAIVGTVKDPTGRVIAGANAKVTNPYVGVTHAVKSGEDGAVIFLELPPGTYTLTVDTPGFKTLTKTAIVVPVSTKVNVGDVMLEVGSVSESVTVEAKAAQLELQSESGERSSVVTNRQLRDIALNGRNVVDLLKTVPGVIAAGTITTSTVTNVVGQFNVNGTRSLQHEYTVDGITNLNLGNNTGGLVSVNPDAVEEVKVLTSNYQAQYGRAGGGVIALTTRSGTSEYHGGLRYFRRHDSMNANTFFNDARGGNAAGFPRPLYRFNYYGWDFGGPVRIPHIVNGKDKLFFFVSQEYYRQLVPQLSSVNIRVPTLLERQGDFSQSVDGTGKPIVIKDPTTGLPFPGNIIPPGSIYGPGQAIINFLPKPNTTAGGNIYNFSSQAPSSYPRQETIVRGDWQINPNTRLSLSWINNQDDQQFAYGTTTASWNWPLTTTDRKNGPGNISTLSLTRNFGASLVNEFVFGSGRGGVLIAPSDNKATRNASGINTPLLFPDANTSGLIPSLTFNGIPGVATAVNTSVFGIFDQHFTIWQAMDNLTKVHGKHIFKFGFYYQSAANASNSQTHVESDIDFSANASNPLNTSNPFANALLGDYNSYTQQSLKPTQSYLYHDISWYAQDTWKLTPTLTLDLGMRFSHYQPTYNEGGPSSFFDAATFDPARAPALYRPVCVGASTCSPGQATYRAQDPTVPGTPTLGNTQPGFNVGRLVPGTGNLTNGLVLTTTDKNYPVSGLNTSAILYQPRLGFAWDMLGRHRTVLRGGFGITPDRPESLTFAASNPPFVVQPTLNFGRLQDITPGAGTQSPLAVSGFQRHAHFPMVYSYSMGIQQNLGSSTVLDVAFVGSQSRHNVRRFNLNTPGYGTTFTAGAQDPTKYAGGTIPGTEPGLPSEYSAAGVSFSGANTLPTDFLRPYQGYGDITLFQFDGNSTYNSLQAGITHRFRKALTLNAAYTLSRTTTTISDDGTYTNILSPRKFDYGLAAFDRTHYFVANFVWDLPKASRFMGGSRFTRIAFDDWILSGISWAASGAPVELGLTIAGVDAGARLLGTPTSGNLAGQQPRFFLSGSPQYPGGKLNPSAFVVPGIGQIGPYPRFYLRNPGIGNQDLSIFKNIRFNESGRCYLQLRLEAFNVFNHPQFSAYNLTTNVTNAAGKTGAAIFASFTGLTATTNLRPAGSTNVLGTYFGEPSAARDPRILQVATKFYF